MALTPALFQLKVLVQAPTTLVQNIVPTSPSSWNMHFLHMLVLTFSCFCFSLQSTVNELVIFFKSSISTKGKKKEYHI